VSSSVLSKNSSRVCGFSRVGVSSRMSGSGRVGELLCDFQARRSIKLRIRDMAASLLIPQARNRKRCSSRRHLMDNSRLSTIRRLIALISRIHRSISCIWCTVSTTTLIGSGEWLHVIHAAIAVSTKTDDAEEAAA
jgi:hypothetical protein